MGRRFITIFDPGVLEEIEEFESEESILDGQDPWLSEGSLLKEMWQGWLVDIQ